MAEITLKGVSQALRRRHRRRRQRRPRHRRRRVRHPGRAVRLREVDAAADDRRAGGHQLRRPDDRRQARSTSPARRTATSRWCSRTTRCTRTCRSGRTSRSRCGWRRWTRPRSTSGSTRRRASSSSTELLDRKPARPVRRSAAAGRDGPRHRARAEGVPVRRAAVQPRRQAARADAHRDLPAAEAVRHHDGLRHPRPDRGHDPRRPGRRAAQGHPAAGRLAARALQQPDQPVRRRLHRLAVDELPAGHAEGRQARPADRRGRPARGVRRAGCGQRRERRSSPASGPSTSRTRRSSRTRRAAAARRSGARSTSSSGWARSCSSTSRCRAATASTRRAWRSSPASSTRRTCTATATRARSSPGSTRPARCARARRPSSGSTPRALHLFDPETGDNLTYQPPRGSAGQSASPGSEPSAN